MLLTKSCLSIQMVLTNLKCATAFPQTDLLQFKLSHLQAAVHGDRLSVAPLELHLFCSLGNWFIKKKI